MNSHRNLKNAFWGTILLFGFLSTLADRAVASPIDPAMVGTWGLVAADVLHADGSRGPDYGVAPKGMLVIDTRGRYSLQIFKAERPKFASEDKAAATVAEYQSAVMGSSTHFGTISVDPKGETLIFKIENASFPNWEGQQQKRSFELKNNELIYRVVPRPNGDTPISVWRRLP